jgi:spermidine synthase
VSKEICAPESFLTERFVRKLHEHLNSNGVLIAETLPILCSKYEYERNLYHDFFNHLYKGSFNGNTILIGQMSKKARLSVKLTHAL